MSRRSWLLLAGLLLIYYVMAVTAADQKSPAYDEPIHLLGGYTYWKMNDYRIHTENGMLPQRLAAIPLLNQSLHVATEHPDWNRSKSLTTAIRFMHTSGLPPQQMIDPARRAMALTGAAVIVLVFFWSRRLWGETGGWFSAAAAAFCPTMLAHGPMVTSDMTGALSAGPTR